MNYDVFISYSFKKDRVVAEDVCRTLEGFGIRCWIAPRNEDPGISYEEQIESAIKSVKVVVLVSSSGANESIHVQNEIACAATASNITAIVPFRIEDFEYCKKLSYYLRSVHWLDAFPDYKVALTPLVHKVKSLIDRATEPQAVMEVNSKASKRIEQSLEDEHGNINEIALPVLGKAVDEVSLTGLTGEAANHFKKAMGYYRVLRRRSALKELQAIENQDDPIVRYYVARFSHELDGTVSDADFEEACIKARDLGCTDAMVAFAEKHLRDIDSSFDPVSPTECIDWLRKAIAKGSTNALVALSGAYEKGIGVRKDLLSARELLKRASDANSMSGRFAYGFDLLTGDCGEKDVGKAVELFRPLIKLLQEYEDELTAYEYIVFFAYLINNPLFEIDMALVCKYSRHIVESNSHLVADDASVKKLKECAYYFLGLNFLNDDSNPGNARLAFENFQKACSIGSQGYGELELANCYDEGIGVTQDVEKALEYYNQASDKGNSEAQRILALYYLGNDECQNEERGKILLKMAAEGGDAEAAHMYGTCLISGQYFDKNVAEGMKWLEKAVTQDCDADAMNSLGNQYLEGNEVVEKDPEKAFYWFKRGAEVGSANAMESLGIAYLKGQGTIPDMEEAEKWLNKAAENGNATAMCILGDEYSEGDFGERDVAKAMKWWTNAAEYEDDDAMLRLGRIYRDGDEGVEEDVNKAVEWLTKAAEAENKVAARELGEGYYEGTFGKQDVKLALQWLQKAAKLGDAMAMNNIGEIYRDGEVGEVDLDKAIDWFKRAANCESPNADAMYNLGEMYLEGNGVEKDLKEAEKWYCKAADIGDANYEFILAVKYFCGDFGSEDLAKAKLWYEKASEHGSSYAMHSLAESYRDGDLGETDTKKWIYWINRSIDMGNTDAMESYASYLLDNGEEEKSRELFERAAENGNASAMRLLGDKYFEGDFGEKNVVKAMEWWTKAAEHEDGGDSEAMFKLGTTYRCGADGVEEDDDKAFEWLTKAVKAGHGYGCVIMGLRYLSLLDIDFDSYEQFAKTVTESFDDEQARTRAIRKAKGMFNKAIASDDPDAIGYGHLFLARIAKLQGDAEMASAHYAKAEEYGIKEHAASSLFARILNSVSFLKKN